MFTLFFLVIEGWADGFDADHFLIAQGTHAIEHEVEPFQRLVPVG